MKFITDINIFIPHYNKSASESDTALRYYPSAKMLEPSRIHLPPAVCKQFYSEAITAFYSSSVLQITESHTLCAFALAPHACVSRFRQLVIPDLEHD